MKVLILSIFVAISTYPVSTQKTGVLKLTNGFYILPNGAVNDVDPSCNDPPERHLPHPWDCTKFYRCVANRKIWLSCPSTLYFNRVLEVCDWPGPSGCIPGTSPPTKPPTVTTTTKPPTVTTTAKPPTVTTTAKPPTVTTTAKPPTVTTTAKPPTVTTTAKPPTVTTTAKPPTVTTTAKPPTVTTTAKPPTVTTTAKPPTVTTTAKPPTVTTPKPTGPPSGNCPAGIDMNFYPNPNDCRKYWQCIEGIRNDYTCPFRSYFNPKRVNCEPNNGQCDKLMISH